MSVGVVGPQPWLGRSLSCPLPSVGQQPSPSSVLASSVTASGRSSRSSRSVGQGLQSDQTAPAGRSAASLCTSQNGFVLARYKFVPRFYRQGSGLYLSRGTTFILLLNTTEVQIRSSAACWAHQEQSNFSLPFGGRLRVSL